jgi:acyl-coenzyme A thioesterase PaaI-like protein
VSEDDPRTRAASRLRELNHEFIARDLSDDDLKVIEARARELLALARQSGRRRRVAEDAVFDEFRTATLEEGKPAHYLSDSFVTGDNSPVSLGAHFWREGEQIVMEATFGPAFEGAPSMGHGGVLTALIDEAMGLAVAMQRVLAFTARLDVNFRSPVPLHQPVTVRAWLERRDGRKFSVAAVVLDGETVLSEATGLFISVDPEKFVEKLTAG